MAHEKPLITPQTKVGDLLKDFPELEETLVKIAPAFKKLRSPMLRRTVARVTNLAQAARVGGVPVDELIQKLRRAVGQPDPAVSSGSPATDTPAAVAPSWFAADKVTTTFDARRLIKSGDQPIGYVLTDLDRLQAGQIYELITPFEPAPLMDKAISRGYAVWSRAVSPGEHRTAFVRL
jgi:hypothetical protein